jgi:hypothetical protein
VTKFLLPILAIVIISLYIVPSLQAEPLTNTNRAGEQVVTPTTFAPPEELKIFDTLDDCNGNISFSWKGMPYEGKGVFYVIYMSQNPDGPFDVPACKFPSTTRWKTDKKWPFWVSGKKKGYHYIEVNPLLIGEQRDQVWQDTYKSIGETNVQLDNINKEIVQAQKDNKDYRELKTKRATLKKELKSLIIKIEEIESRLQDAPYYFKVAVLNQNQMVASSPVLKGQAKDNWFKWSLLNNFIVMIAFCTIVLLYIRYARKNKNLFLRRITGLDAVEEAVGRATEMGRPIFYQTGISGIASISTICATVVLGKIAEKVAQYDSTLKVPHRDPIVMTVCQEIVKEAYTKAGRPDAYKEDINFYVTGDQFGYTAAVTGMMMREKPAANFFMGYYMAEALLLTEAGAATGAIQIAGTDTTDQLPFFITTCDYTLIGEEFYAASAYLSREPVLMGTIKAQDFGKAILLVVIIIGIILATMYVPLFIDLIKDFV